MNSGLNIHALYSEFKFKYEECAACFMYCPYDVSSNQTFEFVYNMHKCYLLRQIHLANNLGLTLFCTNNLKYVYGIVRYQSDLLFLVAPSSGGATL